MPRMFCPDGLRGIYTNNYSGRKRPMREKTPPMTGKTTKHPVTPGIGLVNIA